jgi:N-acetylglucosaminyl-diphospho-decaprenol L-rhamnosyltransferase
MQKRSSSKKVSIVIVTHNSEAVIAECLKSIPDGVLTYVVDNASNDSTCKIVSQQMPKAKLIASDINLGFGRANNLALANVTKEFCLLLNPDTVLEADSIAKMLGTMERHAEAAIVAPTLYHEDGSIQQSYKTSVFNREKNKAKYTEPSGDLCAQCLSGAVMLLRMKCFKKIGFFDPKIFLFYEDDDLCLKIRDAGYSLVLTPEARVMHLMGRSSPPSLKYIYLKNQHMTWSRLYIEQKYKKRSSARIRAIKEMYIYILKTLYYSLLLNKNKTARSWGRVSGALSFIFGIKI